MWSECPALQSRNKIHIHVESNEHSKSAQRTVEESGEHP
jgi:hypothetical protein